MNRRLVGIIGAVVLAVFGTVILASYVQAARDDALAGERLVGVWVVRDAVEAGTPAADLMGAIERVRIPAKVRPDGAVDELDELDGLVATADLVVGEQRLAARFGPPGGTATRDVPDDRLEVTVELSAERALGGRLAPGDTVGVLLSFPPFEQEGGGRTPNATHLALHKVPVTAVQVGGQSGEGRPLLGSGDEPTSAERAGTATSSGSSVFVTLAVKAGQAEQVVFAAEFGGVWLANEPEGADGSGTRIVERHNVHDEVS